MHAPQEMHAEVSLMRGSALSTAPVGQTDVGTGHAPDAPVIATGVERGALEDKAVMVLPARKRDAPRPADGLKSPPRKRTGLIEVVIIRTVSRH